MIVVGIDLAGKSENSSGFCVLDSNGSRTKLLKTDMEILKEVELVKPKLIAIDAPLWLPHGQPWRPSEIILQRRGFQPVNTMIPSMRMLALRGSHLSRVLRERGYKVIEAFPKAAEKILGLSKEPRKNKDEYEALLCALTAKAYLEGNYEDLSGTIIPK